MFSGALTEWLPRLGASWHTVQVPLNDAGTVTPFGNVSSFRPDTPLRTIGRLLKISWPRKMASLALARGVSFDFAASTQESNSVKTL